MTALLLPSSLVVLLATSVSAQLLVAHRGASYDAPENTLAAFRLAWEQGADAIEGDFRLSMDGHVVCVHDGDTHRTSGVKLVVNHTPLAQLRELDVGSWKGSEFSGERIPVLDEVLDLIPPGKLLFLEIKCGPEIVPVLEKALEKRSAELRNRIVVICFKAEVLAAIKRTMPRVPAYWLSSFQKDAKTGRRPGLKKTLAVLRATGADGLDCHANRQIVDATFVDGMRAAGMALHTWTVDDPQVAAHFRGLGFASITTNRPRWLREHLPSRGLKQRLSWHLGVGQTPNDAVHVGPVRIANTIARKPGLSGLAFDLSPRGSRVTIEKRLAETGTLLLWYKPAPWYDYQTIVDTSAHANRWELWIDRHAQLNFRVDRTSAWLRHQLHPKADAEGWLHLAVTWDRKDRGSQAVSLFVDGRIVANSSWKRASWFAPGKLTHLGGGNPKNTRGRGLVEDAAFFNARLTPGDVSFVYRAGIAGLLRH